MGKRGAAVAGGGGQLPSAAVGVKKKRAYAKIGFPFFLKRISFHHVELLSGDTLFSRVALV